MGIESNHSQPIFIMEIENIARNLNHGPGPRGYDFDGRPLAGPHMMPAADLRPHMGNENQGRHKKQNKNKKYKREKQNKKEKREKQNKKEKREKQNKKEKREKQKKKDKRE